MFGFNSKNVGALLKIVSRHPQLLVPLALSTYAAIASALPVVQPQCDLEGNCVLNLDGNALLDPNYSPQKIMRLFCEGMIQCAGDYHLDLVRSYGARVNMFSDERHSFFEGNIYDCECRPAP